MHQPPRRIARIASAAAALLLALAAGAQAQSNPYQRGPEPTTASLEAAAGPYAVASAKISSPQGFGGGTVYWPTATSDGPFGVIAVAPGFIETEATNTWLGKRWASHGFVVITINVLNLLEYPGPRAAELKAALTQIVAQSQTSGSPFFGKIDPTRQGISGHSMGGGASLEVARDLPAMKVSIPLAPWDLQKDFSKVTVPTFIVACQNDFIAPVNTHASTFYNNLPATTPKGFVEIKGADHFCTTSNTNSANKALLGKLTVSWLKRFMDNDKRYSPFLCGAPHQADLTKTGTIISSYRENCPY